MTGWNYFTYWMVRFAWLVSAMRGLLDSGQGYRSPLLVSVLTILDTDQEANSISSMSKRNVWLA